MFVHKLKHEHENLFIIYFVSFTSIEYLVNVVTTAYIRRVIAIYSNKSKHDFILYFVNAPAAVRQHRQHTVAEEIVRISHDPTICTMLNWMR